METAIEHTHHSPGRTVRIKKQANQPIFWTLLSIIGYTRPGDQRNEAYMWGRLIVFFGENIIYCVFWLRLFFANFLPIIQTASIMCRASLLHELHELHLLHFIHFWMVPKLMSDWISRHIHECMDEGLHDQMYTRGPSFFVC